MRFDIDAACVDVLLFYVMLYRVFYEGYFLFVIFYAFFGCNTFHCLFTYICIFRLAPALMCIRVDPTRYEKYIQEISAENSQSQQAFLLDPFGDDEEPPRQPAHSVPSTFSPNEDSNGGHCTPTFMPTLTVSTTPGSIDSDDKVAIWHIVFYCFILLVALIPSFLPLHILCKVLSNFFDWMGNNVKINI